VDTTSAAVADSPAAIRAATSSAAEAGAEALMGRGEGLGAAFGKC
jgi:hypothetical protein